jgi:hypothetical protein
MGMLRWCEFNLLDRHFLMDFCGTQIRAVREEEHRGSAPERLTRMTLRKTRMLAHAVLSVQHLGDFQDLEAASSSAASEGHNLSRLSSLGRSRRDTCRLAEGLVVG